MRSSNDPSQIGSKLAPKLVHVISETIVATKRKLLDTEHRARVHSMQEIIDRAGKEVADLHRPLLNRITADADLPDDVRQYLTNVGSGRHQWQALAGLALGTTGAGNAITQVLSNTLAPSIRKIISEEPELIPSPELLVQMGCRGSIGWDLVYAWGHGQGYNDDVLNSLREATYSWPDLSTTLELLRRGTIGADDARLFLTRSGIKEQYQDTLLNLVTIVPSPADLADMVVRGIKTEADASGVAFKSGVPSQDFHDLTLLTGQPPGLEQMLEGYRRGFIDQATLERGIRESRYRNEWIPLLEKLRYSPISVADAVNAVVQNHLTPAQGEAISELNGLEPGQFTILQETAGEPLSRTEMEELYNRGLVTQEQVNQALRESRVKDKYIDLAFQLHRRIIPVRSLHLAVSAGTIDHATAVTIAMESGYTKRDAEILTATSTSVKTDPYKKEVVTAVETAYIDNAIQRSDAQKLIESMGFAATEAGFILEAADFKRGARVVSQVSAVVRSRYVSRKIPRTQAGNDLDAIGVPASQRDSLLMIWDIELDANTRTLTEAQVVKAVNKNLMTPEDGAARLTEMGYSASDADLLLKGA